MTSLRITGFVLALTVALPAIAGGVGRFSISSNPSSSVMIDGKPFGKTPINRVKISPGKHHIKLSKASTGSSVEFEISVSEGKHVACEYNFDTGEQQCHTEKTEAKATHGTLNVNSKPEGAEVILDGKSIGKTPLENLRVNEGHHVVDFSYEGKDTITKEVDVKASQSLKVQVEFP